MHMYQAIVDVKREGGPHSSGRGVEAAVTVQQGMYEDVVLTCVAAEQWERALAVFAEMREAGLQPSPQLQEVIREWENRQWLQSEHS